MSEIDQDVNKDIVKDYVSRVENLEEEKKQISDDLKDLWQEIKLKKIDTKALKELIKLRKIETDERIDYERNLFNYKKCMDMETE